MNDKRTILEIICDNLCDMTGEIERNIENQNSVYKDIVNKINLILNQYPKIANLEFAKKGIYFELDELKALYELHILSEAKRAYEEQEYYLNGIRDCFEFIVPLLNVNLKKIEEEIR